MADPVLLRDCDGFCWVGEVNVELFNELEETASGIVFTNGDVGNDIGDDKCSGDVGVPKLEGRDIFESEHIKEFLIGSGMSDIGSGVQRTVGKDIG